MSTMEPQEVDFIVIREDYSRFLLHDGTILKAKIVLKRIFFTPLKTPEGYPANMAFDTTNIIAALVHVSLKRQPSTDVFNPQKDVGKEVGFEEQEIKTQEYMSTNGYKISIKPVVVKVFRYDKYNNFGEPIYNAMLQMITNIDKIESTGM